MSNSAKTKRKQDRLKARRNRRSANKAKYEAQMMAGKNSKKAVRLRKRKTNDTKHSHAVANCGNPGCFRCSSSAVSGRFNLFKRTHGGFEAARFLKRVLGRPETARYAIAM